MNLKRRYRPFIMEQQEWRGNITNIRTTIGNNPAII